MKAFVKAFITLYKSSVNKKKLQLYAGIKNITTFNYYIEKLPGLIFKKQNYTI